MATRLFARGISTSGGYTVTPAPDHYKNLIGDTFGGGVNGNTVVLAAGASAFSYALNARFATAIPNFSGTAAGSFRIFVSFQAITPTNIYTKIRVHRATLSGTAYTIVASSEWSEERLTNKLTQRFEFFIDQVDLGTWATNQALIVEYNYRNAGASSLSPQPTGGGYYINAVHTPFTTSAAFGYVNQLPVGQRLYNYSQGGIRGTSRYLKPQAFTNTSSGTATGTKGGANFSGTVTGVSTSTGIIAAGRQGYRGAITGSSTSSGTIATGRQGYVGTTTGASSSSGVIASGRQGYAGTVTGSSTSSGTATGAIGFSGSVAGQSLSTGTATGTKGGSVDPIFPPWWLEHQAPQKQRIQAFSGHIRIEAIYVSGRVRGTFGASGNVEGVSVCHTQILGTRAAGGKVAGTWFIRAHKPVFGRARDKRRIEQDILVMIGEL